jgi:hypothetical protein
MSENNGCFIKSVPDEQLAAGCMASSTFLTLRIRKRLVGQALANATAL